MNAGPGVRSLQVTSLLARLREEAESVAAGVDWDADAEVDAILGAARRDARARVRAAAREQRRAVAERVRAARAAAGTRERAAGFERDGALLAAGLAALPGALDARWRDPAARRKWCAATARLAARRLVARDWTATPGRDLDAADRAEVEAVARAAGATLAWAPGVATGGLVVAGGGARVDATCEGLLADRAAVGALLLALAREVAR